MMPVLTIMADLVGWFGGAIVAKYTQRHFFHPPVVAPLSGEGQILVACCLHRCRDCEAKRNIRVNMYVSSSLSLQVAFVLSSTVFTRPLN